jgi:hypothetical protein
MAPAVRRALRLKPVWFTAPRSRERPTRTEREGGAVYIGVSLLGLILLIVLLVILL